MDFINPMRELNAFGIVTVKKSAIAPNTFPATSLTFSHTAITLFLKSSLVAKSVMRAVTSAATTVITMPMGLAAITVLRSFCAMVIPSVVAFHTLKAAINPCIMFTTFHANIPAAIPAMMEIIIGPFFDTKEIKLLILSTTASTRVLTWGIFSLTSAITSLITGCNSSPIGFTNSVSRLRPSSVIWLPISLYLFSLISARASFVVEISPWVFTRARTASSPKSSHLVPYKVTPKRFLCTSSSHAKRALFTVVNASLAPSPPSANFCFSSSALRPNCLKASSAVPSFTLMPNSLTASLR